MKKIQLSNEVAYAEPILASPRSGGSLKSFFLAHSIPHQATNGGVIDNTETDQQALAPQKNIIALHRTRHCLLQCIAL